MHKIKIFFSLFFIISIHGMDTLNYDESYTYDEFKKEYIDKYFPQVKEEKELLLKNSPTELKQWFENVKQGGDLKPVLLYGASGVGKTMTCQALVQEANCSLCYVYTPATMRWDWAQKPFKKEYLDKLTENSFVIVDNIERLAQDDVDNLLLLTETCNAKKNLHLLVVAYHAKENMPKALFNQFRRIKFPVPTANERLNLLKRFIERKKLANDVDENFLTNFTAKLSNYTARDLEGINHLAIMNAWKANRNSHEKITLSRYDFEEALNKLEANKQSMEAVFDECE